MSVRVPQNKQASEDESRQGSEDLIRTTMPRIKERTIQDVIRSVSLWRLMYTGFTNKQGVFIKKSLEDAAKEIKISKKSLDDYLMQLRMAKKFGFDFDSHIHEKIGVVRSFVRKRKEEEKLQKKGSAGGNDSQLIGNQISPQSTMHASSISQSLTDQKLAAV